MVQIQGEAGYIYVRNRSNSCSEITLEAGADSKLPFTRQDDAPHGCYEAEELTAILQSQNQAAYEYRKRLTSVFARKRYSPMFAVSGKFLEYNGIQIECEVLSCQRFWSLL